MKSVLGLAESHPRQENLTCPARLLTANLNEISLSMKMEPAAKKIKIVLNPLDLPEIVEHICSYLPKPELKRCQSLSSAWFEACQRELSSRKLAYSTFRWINASEQRHEWYDRCGNDILYHHAQCGALNAMKRWSTSKDEQEGPIQFQILFATGAVYVNFMVNSGLNYVLKSELITASEVINDLKTESVLFLSAFKLLACDTCAPGDRIPRGTKKVQPYCDLISLKIPKLPNIRPFQYANPLNFQLDEINTKSSTFRQKQIEIFKAVTQIDPQKEKILGIVVLNVKELMFVFRRIWQDFGPFPLIGCDSEGLAWHLNEKDPKIKSEQLTLSTAGFVITQSPENPISVASLVLTIEDEIEAKLNQLKESGFNSKNSFGIALSSCMRGYDGDDINHEHIEAKDEIQKKECRLFHEIVGENLIGAQVEDIFGSDYLGDVYKFEPFNNEFADNFGLFTPEIHSDDSSTVFLVAGQIE